MNELFLLFLSAGIFSKSIFYITNKCSFLIPNIELKVPFIYKMLGFFLFFRQICSIFQFPEQGHVKGIRGDL